MEVEFVGFGLVEKGLLVVIVLVSVKKYILGSFLGLFNVYYKALHRPI